MQTRLSCLCNACSPILFIMLLYVIQKLVNSQLDTPDNNVRPPPAVYSDHLTCAAGMTRHVRRSEHPILPAENCVCFSESAMTSDMAALDVLLA